MADNKISSAIAGNVETELSKFTGSSTIPDGVSGAGDKKYINSSFYTQWNYYIDTTDIQEVIDSKGKWVVGKGFKADEITTMLLDTIRGQGNDTFNSIIENMIVISEIGEDAYAEIIRDDEDVLINLKPLDTGRMTIITGANGLIKKYEYDNGNGKKSTTLNPEKIFHLSRNRRGDEMHGRSMIPSLKILIDAKQEAIADYRTVMHRFVMPQMKFKLKTDDPTEIAAYKAKMDAVTKTGGNLYEPFDVSESEIISIAPNATLNPLTWIQYLEAAFYKAAGVPQFIVGGGTGFTEASEKIAYLAWQQTVEKYQLFVEEQVLAQLNLVIELEFPASLENELLSDNKKDGAVNIQESELNPASENA